MLNLQFEIIRKSLETTYTHVTFIKSVEEGSMVVTVWTVSEYGINFFVNYDNEKKNVVYVTHDNVSPAQKVEGMKALIEKKLFEEENEMISNFGKETTVLQNGVRVLENEVKNNFSETQKILNKARVTRDIDGESAYNKRDFTQFDKTFEVKVQRIEDYNKFIELLDSQTCLSLNRQTWREQWLNDEISREVYREEIIKLDNCECAKCKGKKITFEQWQNGIVEYSEYNEYTKSDKVRQMKVGKYLNKAGYKQEIIDFYSLQIKEEKTVYLTISSTPQHIVGMSYYAKPNSFDGYNGTSCQDVRHNGNYCKHLGGALYDNKLHIAMLHDSLEDLHDMSDKMRARTLMRPLEVGCETILVPIKYYGNNATKDMLHYSLNQLNEMLIYSTDIFDTHESGDVRRWLSESIDGAFEFEVEREELVEVSEEVDVSCECPRCSGYGNIDIDVEIREDDYTSVQVDCPICNGSGTYETTTWIEVEEYVTVTVDEMIYTYADDSSYYDFYESSDSYEFYVNVSAIERDIKKFVEGEEEEVA